MSGGIAGVPASMDSKNALISVYDKTGIAEFARSLRDLGWKIYASGGTAKTIAQAKVPVTDVAELVGGESILGHRVVTLSRQVHAGLLATDSKADQAELKRLVIPRIDLVCVDLYPLQAEITKPGATENSVLEQTDIGGPALLRSAAKGRRIVIGNPEQRSQIIDWIKAGMPDKENHLRQLAARAEAEVARYALDSARYISQGRFDGVVGEQVAEAVYGENPWQRGAWFYSNNSDDKLTLEHFELIQGSAPSYNNYCDIDRLLQTMTHVAAGFGLNYKKVPAIALGAKHGNVCGAAVNESPVEAIQQMLLGDPRAIFGGIVMLNFELDATLAEILLTHAMPSRRPNSVKASMGRRLLDGVVAPSITADAVTRLKRKGDKCRILANPELTKLNQTSLDQAIRTRYVRGGQLTQDNYTFILDLKSPELEKSGQAAENDLVLGWAIGSTSTSNTVTLIKNGQLIGNGVGQQDRVSVCELAIKRARDAGHEVGGAAAYSDSFFPFPDGPQVLADAGISSILATSGSVNDDQIKAVCRKAGVSLYLIPDKIGRGFYGH